MESSNRIPVSTILLVRNGMKTLPAYYESMREIDDIVVLDGGSTDGSVEFLKDKPNCRIFPQDPRFLDENGYIKDFSGMRNSGYAKAKHPWIICVDTDESATPKLLSELRRIVEEDSPGVYYVSRDFTINGKKVVRFKGSGFDQLRLFYLPCTRGCVKPVHERIDVIPGTPIRKLDAPVTVPLFPASVVRPKFDRYLKLELAFNGKMPWGRWLRWRFIRNMISIPRMILAHVLTYLIPERGPRYPFSLILEQARYSWLLMWRSCPVFTRSSK